MYHVAVWDRFEGWEIVHSTKNKELAEWWKHYFLRNSTQSVAREEFDAEIIAW